MSPECNHFWRTLKLHQFMISSYLVILRTHTSRHYARGTDKTIIDNSLPRRFAGAHFNNNSSNHTVVHMHSNDYYVFWPPVIVVGGLRFYCDSIFYLPIYLFSARYAFIRTNRRAIVTVPLFPFLAFSTPTFLCRSFHRCIFVPLFHVSHFQ